VLVDCAVRAEGRDDRGTTTSCLHDRVVYNGGA
jgi:hypothetical protein